MGVLGITPFLQKTCPEVIKYLPDRLRGLAGKRIVIDGTLITQRLHFAPVPHHYRHVLGWYRLGKELEESNVSAICVFDGKERCQAKEREALRRREARQLVAARSSLELKRLRRLQKLKSIWQRRNTCSPDSASRSTPRTSYRIQDQPFPVTSPPVVLPEIEASDLSPSEISEAIVSLFLEYKNSVSQLTSLPAVASDPPIVQLSVDVNTRADLLMSKAQLQLTLEEGKLWEKILAFQDQPEPTTDLAVNELAQKSSIMSASYLRRTHTPTERTYDESKEILQAMGIPCIESAGPFEAEALAAAIVFQGWADYVASEDTDVLVYEVPLLRNLANRSEPLMMISGADVRTVLDLDRDAFIDFALLLGTDFSERIKNVGPSRALKFIREYGSIEHVIKFGSNHPFQPDASAYLAQIEAARTIFRTLPPLPNEHQLTLGSKDDGRVNQLLERFSLGREVLHNEQWDCQAALAGNYFADDPRMC